MSSFAIHFGNRAHRKLPIAPKSANPDDLQTPRKIEGSCFAHAVPTLLSHPRLVAFSEDAIRHLGLHPPSSADGTAAQQAWAHDVAQLFSGTVLPPGCEPLAHCYCGYQFGNFAGQLGDGAALSLGEVCSPADGETYEVHLKGTGPTVFSRGADGRKVLRSTIREFLCSEAMHHLNIPTTRAVACVTSDTTVERDPHYTGDVIREKCSVVCRTAPSFFRFGSFEICNRPSDRSGRPGPSAENPDVLQKLFEFVAETYFLPQVIAAKRSVAVVDSTTAAAESTHPHLSWKEQSAINVLHAVVEGTAALVAKWQSVGFTHGVLNTDNMSIHGLTIDYGPFAFMTYYDPEFVANSSDHDGRYRFANQPAMCRWNLERLVDAFALIYPKAHQELLTALGNFEEKFAAAEAAIWRTKLGLAANAEPSAVLEMKEKLHTVMQSTWADYNKSIAALGSEFSTTYFTTVHTDQRSRDEYLNAVAEAFSHKLCPSPAEVAGLLKARRAKRQSQLRPEQTTRLLEMAKTEPHVVRAMFGGAPLSQIVNQLETEVQKQKMDVDGREQLLRWQNLNSDQKRIQDMQAWKTFLEHYTDVIAATHQTTEALQTRDKLMRKSNPVFLLYPWILQAAIESAEKGDFSLVQRLVARVETPFDRDDAVDEKLWSLTPPKDLTRFCVSCSS